MSTYPQAQGNNSYNQMTIETVISEVEKQYYTQLFNGCTSNGTHTDGKLIDLLRNSGMPNDTLKVVWTKYCTNTNGCTRPQFYTIMRVIGLIQAGHREETHGNYLLSRGFNMLPKFNGVNRPVVPEQTTPQSMPVPSFPPIGAQDLQSYEKLIFDTKTSVPGNLKAAEAKETLLNSGLDKGILGKVWTLCDRPLDQSTPTGKGYLKKNEWIVCLHLISYGKRGYPIPQVLTREIEAFLVEYSEVNMVQEQAFSSNNSHNPNNFMSNRDSISVQQANQYQPQQPVPPQRETLGLQNQYSGNILPKEYTQPPQENNARNAQAPAKAEPLNFASAFENIGLSPDELIKLMQEMVQSNSTNAKKYSDETDNFNSELKKIEEEKAIVIQSLFQELTELRKLTADNIDLRRTLANETKDIIQRTTQNDNLLGMKEFLTNLENPHLMNEAEQLIKMFGVAEAALPIQRENDFVQAEQTPKQATGLGEEVEEGDFFDEKLPRANVIHQQAPKDEEEDEFFS